MSKHTGESQEFTRLHVDGVKSDITEQAVRDHFSKFGEVVDMDMPRNPSTDQHCGNANITLRSTLDGDDILHEDHNIVVERTVMKQAGPTPMEHRIRARLARSVKQGFCRPRR
ncbi:hypothetical protein SprV_0200954200 [Sparganum proliferum]